ncbi:uncharacterized protein LOC142768723 [Rhipicephalus microplus]|uniref:uncharacterized protein LOC142768723 n=1 Tax=Rhipicephalus microplus TaxID=6941 RepID=UPI003F6CE8B7
MGRDNGGHPLGRAGGLRWWFPPGSHRLSRLDRAFSLPVFSFRCRRKSPRVRTALLTPSETAKDRGGSTSSAASDPAALSSGFQQSPSSSGSEPPSDASPPQNTSGTHLSPPHKSSMSARPSEGFKVTQMKVHFEHCISALNLYFVEAGLHLHSVPTGGTILYHLSYRPLQEVVDGYHGISAPFTHAAALQIVRRQERP